MFPPTGRLTNFASNRRIEDVSLRYIDRPDDLRGGAMSSEEHLYQSLIQLKYEAEMLQKVEEIEALEETLHGLHQRKRKAQDKMKFYNPKPENITSVCEARVYQQFIVDAIRHIERMEVTVADNNNNADQITEDSVDSSRFRNSFSSEHQVAEPLGPHLSLNYLMSQNHWNLVGGGSGLE